MSARLSVRTTRLDGPSRPVLPKSSPISTFLARPVQTGHRCAPAVSTARLVHTARADGCLFFTRLDGRRLVRTELKGTSPQYASRFASAVQNVGLLGSLDLIQNKALRSGCCDSVKESVCDTTA